MEQRTGPALLEVGAEGVGETCPGRRTPPLSWQGSPGEPDDSQESTYPFAATSTSVRLSHTLLRRAE